MNAIQLLYAQSIIAVRGKNSTQQVEFAILVDQFFSGKQITVHWAGNDNVWQVLPARFHCKTGQNREQWIAKTNWRSSSGCGLPGTIRFAIQCQVTDRTYWDNNHHLDYFLKAEDLVLHGPGVLLAHLNYQPLLTNKGKVQPLALAIHPALKPKQVFVRWTNDSWKTYHQTPCLLERQPAPRKRHRSSRPDIYKPTVWVGKLPTKNAARIDYAFCCETEKEKIWDNNYALNYTAIRAGFKVLTLNLHCYQEIDQEEKFREIARAAHELDIDILCLQEVGEEWNKGKGNWPTNAAKIIQDHLLGHGRSYHLHTDWSHIGFDRFREGSAILSKYRFLKKEAAYVSVGQDIHDIHSRKVVMAQVDIPAFGLINVFSVHLSWYNNGFWAQFEKLFQWAEKAEADKVSATLLCGDFNNKAGSPGYMEIADISGYEDQFLRATSARLFFKIFRSGLPEREKLLADDDRIDFIWAKNNLSLKPTAARIIFSGKVYKKVSDHLGYLVEFSPP